MPVIKKKINESIEFPIAFTYQNTKDPKNELPEHFHDWYEIIYVYSGTGTFFIDKTFYSMTPGDIFLIPKDMIHHTIQDKDNPLTYSVLFFETNIIHREKYDDLFSYMNLFQNVTQYKKYRISLDSHQRALLENFFIHISFEMSQKSIGYKSAIISWVHFLLLTLNRIVLEKKPIPIQSIDTCPKWMKEILNFIDCNLHKPLSLSNLSEKAYISPEHFSRVFKSMVGLNLTSYLNSKRVIKAKDLLLTTNKKVSAIAEEVGFNSTPHFYRIFKKNVGLTPLDYRKLNKI